MSRPPNGRNPDQLIARAVELITNSMVHCVARIVSRALAGGVREKGEEERRSKKCASVFANCVWEFVVSKTVREKVREKACELARLVLATCFKSVASKKKKHLPRWMRENNSDSQLRNQLAENFRVLTRIANISFLGENIEGTDSCTPKLFVHGVGPELGKEGTL